MISKQKLIAELIEICIEKHQEYKKYETDYEQAYTNGVVNGLNIAISIINSMREDI